MQPSKPLTAIPIPSHIALPNMGPIEDEPKPKRVRRKKDDPAQPPKPRAQKNRNEKEIRAILERLTGRKWPSCRPSFLRGVNGRNLEIDMYCRELGTAGIAVEHQGQQHLGYVPFFHKNGYSDFVEQQQRDALKAALLRHYKIRFVQITHVEWDALAGCDPKTKDNFLLLKLGAAE